MLRLAFRAMCDSILRLARGDSARMRDPSFLLLNLFGVRWAVATLDTTLANIPGFANPAPQEISGAAGALGALQQGDTLGVRRAARDAFPADRQVQTWTQYVSLYMWGRLFAALGDPARAVQAYALLDSASAEARVYPDFQVLSWAERGGLYQALGDTTRAIEMYQAFVDAWRGADPELQPLVERARKAVAAMKGEVEPEIER